MVEHRNFALGKISPKGKFRSSPSPKIFTSKPKAKAFDRRWYKSTWKEGALHMIISGLDEWDE